MSTLTFTLVLLAVAAITFIVAGLWWLSGWQGGNRDEPGPIGTTIVVVVFVALVLWGLDLCPF